MKGIYLNKGIIVLVLIVFTGSVCLTRLSAQQTTDTLKGKNLYRPNKPFIQDTAKQDRDIVERRLQFTKDSIFAREQFLKDSIQRRVRMLDSLVFLQKELKVLLDGYFRTVSEDVILRSKNITIMGDSILGDYIFLILPFGTSQPYTPWKLKYQLTGTSFQYTADNSREKITSVQSPFMNCSIAYGNNGSIMIIHELGSIERNSSGLFYISPVDSVFLDRDRRVVKIKKYQQLYGVTGNNQRGAPVLLNLVQVKQYEYGSGEIPVAYQVVNFCARWKSFETSKVCNIIRYTLTEDNNAYRLSRSNDPSNPYSDGVYTFVFDTGDFLKEVSFRNSTGTESRKHEIELNKEGNISCYIFKKADFTEQSVCFTYHLNEPNARYQVEAIITSFEKDGISYYQKNSTTGKIRTRDRMTLEWGPWK
jgi:hypothetical protein